MLKLTTNDVTWGLRVCVDDLPFEGNALASGDDDADREAEAAIRERLDRGDEWAWAAVEVTAEWEGLSASDHLGGCSYESEEDFKRDPYYADMQAECLGRLQAQAERIARRMARSPTSSGEVVPASWGAKASAARGEG